MMSNYQIVLFITAIVAATGPTSVDSFSPNSIQERWNNIDLTKSSSSKTSKSSNYHKNVLILSMSAISDAQALLAKAKALREQAEAEEDKLHSTLIEKRHCQNMETDSVIRKIFPRAVAHSSGSDSSIDQNTMAVANRIDELKLSTQMLERVVERIHEREIAARGLEHVELSTHHEQVEFVRVAAPQEEELARVQGLIQRLIDAAEVLDNEHLKKNAKEHHHADATHWSRGTLSKVLKDKAHFLGREHDEEFKNRLQEFYEAARKKKDYDSYSM